MSLKILIVSPADAPARALSGRLAALGHDVSTVERLSSLPELVDLAVVDRDAGPVPAVPCLLVDAASEAAVDAPLNVVGAAASARELRQAIAAALRPTAPLSGDDIDLDRFAAAMDRVRIPVYLLDEESRLHYVNPAACAAHGMERAELLDCPVWAIDGTVDRESWSDIWDQVAGVGGATLESEHLRADGTGYPVEINASVVIYQRRRMLLAIVRDISSQRQAVESLNEQRREAQRYLNTAGVMLVALDREGRTLLVNPKACEVLGYAEHELVGRDWFEQALPEDERDEVRRLFDDMVARGDGAETNTNSVRRRDGSRRLIHWRNELIVDEAGTVQGLLGSGEDITERRRLEARLDRQRGLNEHLTRIARNLFAAPTEGLDAAIEQALAEVGAFCGVDRAYVFSFDKATDRVSNSHEWCAEGIPSERDHLQDLDAGMAPEWMRQHLADRPVVIDNVSLLDDDWGGERAMLEAQGVQSVAALPLTGSRGLSGFIGFDSVRRTRAWQDEEIRALQLLGEIIALARENGDNLVRLQDSEYRWNFALEGSGQGVWDWNVRTDRVFLSRVLKEMLGYCDEEIGDHLSEWAGRVHPEDFDRVMSDVQDHLAGRTPVYVNEHRLRCKDGTYLWILDRGMVVARDAEGRPLRMIGTHSDVDEQHHDHERVLQSEARLEAMFDNSQVGIALLSGYREMERCNQRLADIFGYDSPDDLVGISMREIHLDQQRFEEFGRTYYETLRQREMLHVEYQLRRRDGTAVWCTLSGKALDGNVPADLSRGVLWVVDDISHIKDTERSLRAQRDLFSGGPTMVFQWPVDYSVPMPFCSSNVKSVLGYDPADLMREAGVFDRLIHPEDVGRVLGETRDYLAAGAEEFEQEYRIRHADGRYLSVYDYTRVVRDERGAVELMHGYLLDVTRLRESEAENLRMERELQQARKLEALGQLTGGVAHEFNNMLAIILGSATLLGRRLKETEGVRTLRYLDQIEHAGGRARDMIAQMLSFSRSADRRVARLHTADAVAEALKLLRGGLASSIDLAYSGAAGVADVLMDAGELQQVLTNLVVNARDAMDSRGTVRIDVAMTVESGTECPQCHSRLHGEWVDISVSDSGPGIDTELLERIFDPFFTTKPVGRGTGLGLSVVQGIMERNGGHVLVDSRPGEGCRFRLLLPPATGQAEEAEPEADLTETPATLAGRVLLVDDEPALVDIVAELLNDMGLEVVSADSGGQALEILLSEDSLDLLITDHAMPGMLGTELARAAREHWPGLPIILVTGYRQAADYADAEGSVDRVLFKPTRPDDLRTAVQELLGGESRVGTAR